VSNLSNVRILVVEDDEDSALLMGEVLREHGFTVDIAHDGASALEAAARTTPHIGVLDLGLPDMDGFELARRLRALPQIGTTVQLVALSGYGSAEDVREAHAAGFNLHLTKPILPGLLANTLTARLPDALKGS
jgi:CheY-like chemotaxis protein